MAHVEHPDGLPHSQVLLDDAAAGVLDRHLPATEICQLGAQVDVARVQRRSAQLAHAPDASIARYQHFRQRRGPA
jgi:hypothetical protein